MPLKKEPLSEELKRRLTEKTFDDGVFGIKNPKNTNSNATKEIMREQEKGGSYSKGTVKYLLHKIFPPYRDLQLVPWYKFVDGKPWLLPAAWIYRWGYCLIHKNKQLRKMLAAPFSGKAEISEREKLLKSIGL